MAYDKIIAIHARLDRCIQYALNDSKTQASGHCLFQGSLNCPLSAAHASMTETKKLWNKEGGVLGYHIIHSYAPGETTPEQAHAAGVEFANRLLGERYEAVIATHLDRGHLHCHIVFNSVSFVDGRKYANTFQDYFGDIRGLSNQVSREFGLPVTEPTGKGKSYVEWDAERQGKTTIRSLVRQDVEAAIGEAFTFQSFLEALKKHGYSVKYGPNVKHTAIRPPGGTRFLRLDSLRENFTEEAIRQRLSAVRSGQLERPSRLPPTVQIYKIQHRPKVKPRLHGFQALYVHYLYVLGGRRRKSVPFPIRIEVKRLEQYKRQFRLLHTYRITGPRELTLLQDALQAEIDALVSRRKVLYGRKRRGEDCGEAISEINQRLRQLRGELRTCRKIEDTVPSIRQQLEECKSQEKVQTKPKERRKFQWR